MMSCSPSLSNIVLTATAQPFADAFDIQEQFFHVLRGVVAAVFPITGRFLS
jgi:hypothetical protein